MSDTSAWAKKTVAEVARIVADWVEPGLDLKPRQILVEQVLPRLPTCDAEQRRALSRQLGRVCTVLRTVATELTAADNQLPDERRLELAERLKDKEPAPAPEIEFNFANDPNAGPVMSKVVQRMVTGVAEHLFRGAGRTDDQEAVDALVAELAPMVRQLALRNEEPVGELLDKYVFAMREGAEFQIRLIDTLVEACT